MSRNTAIRSTRWLSVALGLLAGLGCLALTVHELELARSHDDLPRWDMAKYGAAGARMADRMAALDPAGLSSEINALGSWPPGFPLLQAPAFLFFGPDFGTARALVALGFGACLAALAWVALVLDRRHGLAGALLALALMTTSPLHRLFSSLVMLEIPGTLFGLLALGAYLRAVEAPWRRGWWHLCGAATLALFFIKYNYGLLWLAPLVLMELGRRLGAGRPGEMDRWLDLLVGAWRRIDFARPWHLFLVVYLAGLVALRASGGIDTEVMGLRLRATSLGNPAFALYALVILRAALAPRRSWARCRGRWRRLDTPARILVAWVLVPLALWMAIPPHLKDFFGFVENRDSGLTGATAWLFYPRVLATDYSPWPWLGGILPLLALLALTPIGLRRHDHKDSSSRRRAFARRVLLVMTGLGLAAVVGHPYKLPRFLFTVLPPLWLGASLGIVGLLRWLTGGENHRRAPVVTLAAAFLATILVIPGEPQARQLAQAARPGHTVPPESLAVVEAILGASREVEGPTLVLGTWNLLSPGLLEWRAIGEGLSPEQRPIAARSLGRRARASLARADQVLLLEPSAPDSLLGRAMVDDTRGEEPLRHDVTTGSNWRLDRRLEMPAAGAQLSVFLPLRHDLLSGKSSKKEKPQIP